MSLYCMHYSQLTWNNNEILQKFYNDVQDKKVGILSKKNIFDKGSKIKLSKDTHEVVGFEGYNLKLDNDRMHPPKDIQVLKLKKKFFL